MKYIFIFISFLSFAQLPNDWNATEILCDMQKSWSVGNGCLEANNKVVNVYGVLRLNNYTLEIMDATIQVIDGWVENNGLRIDILNSDCIIYKCSTSELVEYLPTLSN